LAAQRVHQVITTWKQRAIQMGYIQEIPRPHAQVRPLDASPIQVFLTQVLDTRTICRPQDSPTLEVVEPPAEEANSGPNGNPLTVAGEGDEVTLLRNENRLLKELVRGLMANKDALPVGAFVEEARQFAEV
jgi:hypothetical protein